MIQNVLTLFKTLLEIIFLRKGPEDIPHSSALFIIVTGIWLLVGLVAVMVVETYTSQGLFMDLILALLGLLLYSFIVNTFSKSERLLRALTAILGCGVLFSILLFGGRFILPLALSESEVDIAVQLIWFWSIPVEGHIIARTIERQWFIGFLIALAVLFAQLQLFAVLKPAL